LNISLTWITRIQLLFTVSHFFGALNFGKFLYGTQ
jgi:hypothetical protein